MPFPSITYFCKKSLYGFPECFISGRVLPSIPEVFSSPSWRARNVMAVFISEVLQSSAYLGDPSLDTPYHVHILLILGATELTDILQVRFYKSRIELIWYLSQALSAIFTINRSNPETVPESKNHCLWIDVRKTTVILFIQQKQYICWVTYKSLALWTVSSTMSTTCISFINFSQTDSSIIGSWCLSIHIQ